MIEIDLQGAAADGCALDVEGRAACWALELGPLRQPPRELVRLDEGGEHPLLRRLDVDRCNHRTFRRYEPSTARLSGCSFGPDVSENALLGRHRRRLRPTETRSARLSRILETRSQPKRRSASAFRGASCVDRVHAAKKVRTRATHVAACTNQRPRHGREYADV